MLQLSPLISIPGPRARESLLALASQAGFRYLRGLYSFSENFGGSNGHLRRKALFGNQWIRAVDGPWIELTNASFSHDPTGKSDRLDRFMGIENGQFFLSHGGFVPGFTSSGEKFTRAARSQAPTDLVLPEIPLK